MITCLLPGGGSASTGLFTTGLTGSASVLGLLGTTRGGVVSEPKAEAGMGVLCEGEGELCERGVWGWELQSAGCENAFSAAISAGVMSSSSGSVYREW